MPYLRVNKCVYRKRPDGSRGKLKGCSSNVAKAKDYLTVLNMRHAGIPPKRKK